MALLGASCVLIYLPGKLGASGLATNTDYIPRYTWALVRRHGNHLERIWFIATVPRAPGRHSFSNCRCHLVLRSPPTASDRMISRGVVRPNLFADCRYPSSCCWGSYFIPPLAGTALFVAACLVSKNSLWKLFAEALNRRGGSAKPRRLVRFHRALPVHSLGSREPSIMPFGRAYLIPSIRQKNTVAESQSSIQLSRSYRELSFLCPWGY